MQKIDTIIREEYGKIKNERVNFSLLNESKITPPMASMNITSGFGPRIIKGEKKQHNGIDIAAKVGTPVKSVASGTVSTARVSNDACGGTIVIKHNNDFQSTYCHMNNIQVSVGDKVTEGETIGTSGGAVGEQGSGNSLGPHLHFGLQLNSKWVDPELYIGQQIPNNFNNLSREEKLKILYQRSIEKRNLPDDHEEWSGIDIFQTVLDFAGFIPGIGDIIDVINAIIYFARGKYFDGFLSVIAIIPVVGSVAKFGVKGALKALSRSTIKGSTRGFRKALKAAAKGSDLKSIQLYWEVLIKEGLLDRQTLKVLMKLDDKVAGMLKTSKKKLKSLGFTDEQLKIMDDVADIIHNVSPSLKNVSIGNKILKGTGKVGKKIAKTAKSILGGAIAFPARLLLSPITIPLAMTRASLKTLTPKGWRKATQLFKKTVGKSVDNISDMERAVRHAFKDKLKANPILLSNMIKINRKPIGTSFKVGSPIHKLNKKGGPLWNIYSKSVKDIESTLSGLVKKGDISYRDYKRIVAEVTQQSAATKNPYYAKFISDNVNQWAFGHNPILQFKGAWDSKPFTTWMKPGTKSYDVISNELQDFAEMLGLDEKDDPQGVVLQLLVILLRNFGMMGEETTADIKKFSKDNIKPVYNWIGSVLDHYATMDNVELAAKEFKENTYDKLPGLSDDGEEISANVATTSEKWNYLSTHVSDFSSTSWSALTMIWGILFPEGVWKSVTGDV